MWTYEQRSGRFLHDGQFLVTGYSGFGEHRNRPESERLPGLGPLPAGRYSIGDEFNSDTHGRSGFLIHGDSREHPGLASHGCIILPRQVREAVAASDDELLEVTP